MKIRKQKKKINTLKCVDRNGDVVPLLKYFKKKGPEGNINYYAFAMYLEELIKQNYIEVNIVSESVALSDKARKFLAKTCPKYVCKPC